MGWGNMDFDPSFPDAPKMVRDLNDRGMNLLIWVANRAWNNLLVEGSARRYL
jgi:alpha-glucosidase (family GH31 glycosyl hydrolase)